MRLVVDTNILISFFRDSPVRYIILLSDLFNLQLYSPEYVFAELGNIRPSLLKYSKLSLENIEFAFTELQNLSSSSFKEFESEAKQLIHDKDVPIFALALKLKCGIWSNEPGFKKQSKIEVFNTKELKEFLHLL